MIRLILIILASFSLAACGGGGGGGGGTPVTVNNSTDDDSDNADDNNEQPETFNQQQNEYLPLIEGSGWIFSAGEGNGLTPPMTAESASITIDGVDDPIYSFSSDLGELGSLVQYFVSTPDHISLVALDGPVEIDVGFTVTVTKIRFSEPIQVVGDNLTNKTLGVTLYTSNFAGIPINTLDAEVTVSNSSGQIEIDGYDTEFPALMANVSIRLFGNVFGNDVDFTITENSAFVKGVGFASRDLSIVGFSDLNLTLSSLVNIPEPILYVYRDSTLELPVSSALSMDGVLSPDNYTILNQSDLDDIDWMEVTEGNAAYAVNVFDDSVPATTVTQLIYMGTSDSDAQIPVNVTLVVE